MTAEGAGDAVIVLPALAVEDRNAMPAGSGPDAAQAVTGEGINVIVSEATVCVLGGEVRPHPAARNGGIAAPKAVAFGGNPGAAARVLAEGCDEAALHPCVPVQPQSGRGRQRSGCSTAGAGREKQGQAEKANSDDQARDGGRETGGARRGRGLYTASGVSIGSDRTTSAGGTETQKARSPVVRECSLSDYPLRIDLV